MTRSLAIGWLPRLGLVLALGVVPAVLAAAERRAPAKATPESVEMFAAMKAGQLEVKLIPKNSKEANVLITNKTKKPLSVRLPEAFAGVPVLAQALDPNGGAGGRNNGGGYNSNNNSNQGIGGGMGGMGMGGMGMGMFNVAPEKVGQLKVPCVCLEHGKREPRAAVPYQIKPIDEFTKDVKVHELLKLFSQGKYNQRIAQAAAWHLSNNMTWEQLAAKRIEHANGTTEPYFTPQELQAAMGMSVKAVEKAKERSAPTSGSQYSAAVN
ncbi:MAG: hypothetical protein ACYC35_04515 [Pirellulales bacterium]